MIKRLIAALCTLWLVMTLTFFLVRLLPGGPFQNPKVPPEIQQVLEQKFGLNRPVTEQYVQFLGNCLKGDLGPSLVSESRSVSDMVAQAATVSFSVGLPALVIGGSVGILAGLLAGLTQRPWLEGLLSLIGISSLSLPAFVCAGGLILLFSLTFKVFPSATLATPWHYVLPVWTLSIVPFAFVFSVIRSSVADVKHALYIAIKHSFGLGSWHIAFAHILRNALLPFISILGPLTAAILTGSFAVEYMFAIPGLGKYFVSSVLNRDYTVVMGITLFYAVLLVILNSLTDMLLYQLDPRLQENA
jgi:oligopeptide transport system permease protein